MARKVAIFGAGVIGSEAGRQFKKEGDEVIALVSSRFLTRSDGTQVPFKKRGDTAEILSHVRSLCRGGVDLAVFALPSAGPKAVETEMALMQPFLESRTPMVLAGKAALSSEHFYALEPHLPHMGINAMVGGATGMLDEMLLNLNFSDGRDIEVEVVLNGTLSYIMTGAWKNRPLQALIREAVTLKYAEPGIGNRMPDPLDVFKGEVEGDVPKKALIVLRRVFGKFIGRHVGARDLRTFEFTEDAMYCFTASNARRKFVVRFSTKKLPPQIEINSPGSIWAEIDGKVFVSGGFLHIPKGSALDEWVPDSGPGNAARIVQGGQQRIVSADGAGDLATVGTLIRDTRRLCPSGTSSKSAPKPKGPDEFSRELTGPLSGNV